MGWIECVGHADRACYDLCQHTKATGVRLDAEMSYDSPKEVLRVYKMINKKDIGKKYRKEGKPLLAYLESLSDSDAKALDKRLEEEKEETITICDSNIDFKVTR